MQDQAASLARVVSVFKLDGAQAYVKPVTAAPAVSSGRRAPALRKQIAGKAAAEEF
jgi:hypothetical protein